MIELNSYFYIFLCIGYLLVPLEFWWFPVLKENPERAPFRSNPWAYIKLFTIGVILWPLLFFYLSFKGLFNDE